MTKGKITGLAATLLVLASASAFAQTPMPATGAQEAPLAAAPSPAAAPKLNKVALQTRQKACTKEWGADKKAGKTKDITYKSFVQKCMHEGV